MKAAIPIDSTPYPATHLPFANETEVQQFVEEYAETIFGLKVISSTRRDGRRLFGIDVFAVDAANTPIIIECKWDLVDPGAIRQLVRYKKALQAGWSLFEKRITETSGMQVAVESREPVLVAIGYRYAPSVLSDAQSIVCLTYAYHDVTFTGDVVEQQRPGRVSIQHAHQILMPKARHPTVSKQQHTSERLLPLPPSLRAAFWEIDGRLRGLDAVKVVYGGKNFVRYRVPRGRFAEAKICPKSIQWRYCQSGGWKDGGQSGSVEMLAACDLDKIFDLLRQAYVDAG